jgi:Zn-dependent peptidase ImmA (M78 family)
MSGYKERARVKAIEARNELGIGQLDSINIFKLLKNRENISIITTPLKGDISGIFMRKGDTGLVIINSRRSLGHQYFTAAHEYYHLKYNHGMTGRLCAINKYDEDYEVELEANSFASYFLVPDDALRYYLNSRLQDSSRQPNMRDLIYLENYFAVSHALMLLRLKNMGVISEAEADQMKTGVTSAAIRLGNSPALYQDTADQGMVIYSNYAELAEELLEAEKITYGKYEELMLEGGYGEILFGDGEENGNSDAGNL